MDARPRVSWSEVGRGEIRGKFLPLSLDLKSEILCRRVHHGLFQDQCCRAGFLLRRGFRWRRRMAVASGAAFLCFIWNVFFPFALWIYFMDRDDLLNLSDYSLPFGILWDNFGHFILCLWTENFFVLFSWCG